MLDLWCGASLLDPLPKLRIHRAAVARYPAVPRLYPAEPSPDILGRMSYHLNGSHI